MKSGGSRLMSKSRAAACASSGENRTLSATMLMRDKPMKARAACQATLICGQLIDAASPRPLPRRGKAQNWGNVREALWVFPLVRGLSGAHRAQSEEAALRAGRSAPHAQWRLAMERGVSRDQS